VDRRPPRERIQAACAQRGKEELVAGCIDLLNGRDVDADLVGVLGGRSVSWSDGPAYWLRVWAARGLLWAWDDAALPALTTALDDEAWRVREMALKVVARHRLDDAIPTVAALCEDPSPRVRAAASRALVRLAQQRA
jgi:HEAT repeat protein